MQRRCAFLVSMASLRPDGGPAPAIRVVVSRQYPVVYMHPPMPDEMPAARASAAAATAAASPSSSQSAAPADAAAAPKIRKLHCNQRAHDTRMAAHVKLCDKRMENLRRAFEDRRAKDKQASTIEEQQAEDEEWQQERAELEAEMQDVCKQVIPYLKLHLCGQTKGMQRLVLARSCDWYSLPLFHACSFGVCRGHHASFPGRPSVDGRSPLLEWPVLLVHCVATRR